MKPDHQSQLTAFAKAALPPLIARYALRLIRLAALTPAGRVVFLVLSLVLAALLVIPAALVALVVFLATQDGASALTAAAVVVVLVALCLAFALAKLRRRWRAFLRAR